MKTDDVVQMTMIGEDDRAHAKAQRRTRETKRAMRKIEREPPPLPNGPCCGRCTAWLEPTKTGDHGTCQFLGIATKQLNAEIPKGTVIDWQTAQRHAGEDGWEELRTRPWFDCTAYTIGQNQKEM